jgi:hypothetical protein
MSRTVKDAKLSSREARLKLARRQRHWRNLGGKVHLGYWRGEGEAGRWLLRVYTGQQKYAVEVLRSTTGDKVVADDVADANDVTVLSFEQAQRRAMRFMPSAPVSEPGCRQDRGRPTPSLTPCAPTWTPLTGRAGGRPRMPAAGRNP